MQGSSSLRSIRFPSPSPRVGLGNPLPRMLVSAHVGSLAVGSLGCWFPRCRGLSSGSISGFLFFGFSVFSVPVTGSLNPNTSTPPLGLTNSPRSTFTALARKRSLARDLSSPLVLFAPRGTTRIGSSRSDERAVPSLQDRLSHRFERESAFLFLREKPRGQHCVRVPQPLTHTLAKARLIPLPIFSLFRPFRENTISPSLAKNSETRRECISRRSVKNSGKPGGRVEAGVQCGGAATAP